MGPAASAVASSGELLVAARDDAAARPTLKALDGCGLTVSVCSAAELETRLAVVSAPVAVLVLESANQVDAVALLATADPLVAFTVVLEAAAPIERTVQLLRSGASEVLRGPLTASACYDAAIRLEHTRRRGERRPAPRGWASEQVTATPPNARYAPHHPVLAAIQEGLRSGDIGIPAVDVVVSELRQALRSRETPMAALATLIQRDQNLASTVLRLANSAEFSRGARVTDLSTAVTRIGTRRIETILEALFLHDCYRPKDPRYQSVVLAIWRNAVARATAMRSLAESTKVGLASGTVYVAGLLADVGAMFLLWLVSERAPELGIDEVLEFVRHRHTATGADVLTAWKLDPAMAQLATTHHVPRNPVPKTALWTLSIVAGEIAERFAEDVTAPERPNTADIARCLQELRATESDVTAGAAQIGRELESLGTATA